MATVAEITGAVKRLPKKDLARFRKWFVEYDAAAWDGQFEADVVAGRLDALASEALRQHRAEVSFPRLAARVSQSGVVGQAFACRLISPRLKSPESPGQ